MKLDDLKKAGAKAHQELRLAERKAQELQRKFTAAKALAEQARLKHKHSRKAAKQAKRLALAAEEHVRDNLRAWEKAQKRLAKATKKAAKAKAGNTKRSAPAAAAPRKAARPPRRQTAPSAPRNPSPAGETTPAAPPPLPPATASPSA